jgi:hypothetical protein
MSLLFKSDSVKNSSWSLHNPVGIMPILRKQAGVSSLHSVAPGLSAGQGEKGNVGGIAGGVSDDAVGGDTADCGVQGLIPVEQVVVCRFFSVEQNVERLNREGPKSQGNNPMPSGITQQEGFLVSNRREVENEVSLFSQGLTFQKSIHC